MAETITGFQSKRFGRRRGIPLSRATQKDITDFDCQLSIVFFFPRAKAFTGQDILGDLYEPGVQKVVSRIVGLDGAHFVFQVLPSRPVKMNTIKVEPALPKPFRKPRYTFARCTDGLW